MEMQGLKAKATDVGLTIRKWAIRIAIAAPLLGIGGTLLYSYIAINITYSDGTRTGVVQKLSRKGWICKTVEGELMMAQSPGQPAQVFSFTVPTDDVRKQIEALEGSKVMLSYKQHAEVPSTCFGESVYFVTGVQKKE